MQTGDTLSLALPEAFSRNPAVPIGADTDLNMVRVHGVQPLPARHFQATSVAMTSSNRCKPLI